MTNQEEVLKTITFFDFFSQALSFWELFKFLEIKISPANLQQILEDLVSESKIITINGFYCLKNRENLIDFRFRRFNYFQNKLKKAKNFSKIISWWPGVQGVFLANIIGDHNLKEGSDLDLLIITKNNRIWFSRFFCVLIAKVLNRRPNKRTKKDKICLSFYIDDMSLNLESHLYNSDDRYFIYWLANLEPLFFRPGILEHFYHNNAWLNKYLPNLKINYQPTSFNVKFNKAIILERVLKKFQLKVMPKKLKFQSQDRLGVILEDNIIKLILDDKRPMFIDKFKSSL